MTARVAFAALLAALALAPAAPAATTVGSTLPAWTGDTLACDNVAGCTFVPRTISGQVIAMPYDGVIVRWSARMPTAADTTALDFKAVQLTATGASPRAGQLTLSPPATAGALVSGAAALPVDAGDLIAIDLDDGDEIGITPHTLFNSSSWTYFTPLTSDRPPDQIDNDDFEMAFNATVERDADHDGYGDETQDKCPQLTALTTTTCRGSVRISVVAGQSGIGVVGVGRHMPIHATIGMGGTEAVAGARLELTLPNGLKPVKLSGSAFCTISAQKVICPAGMLAPPNQGYTLDVDAVAERPAVGAVQATGTNAFGDTVSAQDAVRLTTDKRCGLRIPIKPGGDKGTNGGDRLTGTRSDDELVGRGGDDCLTGGPGDDVLAGGDGNDRLVAGTGADLARGNAGNDRLIGGPGRDRLEGGPGDDAISAADGQRDLVRCGPGEDRATVDRLDRVSGCERVRPR